MSAPPLSLLSAGSSESAESWLPDPAAYPSAPGSERPLHVLVVDDEPVVQMLVSRVLQEQGEVVEVASNGAEALELAINHAAGFDFLITDVRMPVMDGWELGREIRARWPELPILYISGYDVQLPKQRQRGNTRTSGFLQKPFDPTALLRSMTELLENA